MFKLNVKLSENLQQEYAKYIAVKSCYDNVYNLVTKTTAIINSLADWEIMFCYLSTKLMEPTYMRHVFLLANGEIVEPLPNIRENALWDSILPFAQLSVDEYIDSALRDRCSDCRKVFLRQELEVLQEHHAIINPFEVSDFIECFAKSAEVSLSLFQAAAAGDYAPFWEYIDEKRSV